MVSLQTAAGKVGCGCRGGRSNRHKPDGIASSSCHSIRAVTAQRRRTHLRVSADGGLPEP